MSVEPVALDMPAIAEEPGPRLQWEIEQFLYAEAGLLDDRRFEDWLALMADDVVYQMPLRTDRIRRDERRLKAIAEEVKIFDDNLERLRTRVKRLRSGTAWSDDPRARVRHLISNVQISRGQQPEEIEVISVFLVYVSRMDEEPTLFSGQRHDVLRSDANGGWKIARRVVIGDQSVIPSNNLTLFF
ncbi:aromatic-ring-hydroxylating dioxygenase subunit beta [Sphingomonas sp. IC081]|uniref:Initial dioxygenase small subunit n=1 Tax=Sphingomonas sp. CB3 TaxID=76582 RepID=O85284_9SPHN|nr:aromatic-ring-hydroxylating dioxygenase subunit beta [Sphingomonas sp. IC081]AAC38617.1 initial dioxygenase small subunit [Sphingomonas sp. CB3]QDK35719.1 benzene 1,2-dioxygenase [Sphingomonas sp. IC081]